MTELTEAHFELHSKNKAKLLEERKKKETSKLFDDWIKMCPVVYYLSEKVDEEVDKIIKYTFDKKVRRK
tara:strand:- start:1049 stop:1255 length:207 start_codon:yes stop_codon:yes gene_type:complete